MPTSFAPLRIRQMLRKELPDDEWSRPIQMGPDGWRFISPSNTSVIVSCADIEDGVDWVHASIARMTMPTYEDLKALHKSVFHGYAYQMFVPESSHYNFHEHALHLWGRLDGKPAMIDPGAILGRI